MNKKPKSTGKIDLAQLYADMDDSWMDMLASGFDKARSEDVHTDNIFEHPETTKLLSKFFPTVT